MKSINAQCPESRKNVSRYFKSIIIRISRIISVGDKNDAVKNKFARNEKHLPLFDFFIYLII